MEITFEAAMAEIVASIKAAGYDPHEQMLGYVSTGKEEYITRAGGAREKIKKLDREDLRAFVEGM